MKQFMNDEMSGCKIHQMNQNTWKIILINPLKYVKLVFNVFHLMAML